MHVVVQSTAGGVSTSAFYSARVLSSREVLLRCFNRRGRRGWAFAVLGLRPQAFCVRAVAVVAAVMCRCTASLACCFCWG